jgi:hypothetical protein
MKAAELVCVNCGNWESEKCGDCIGSWLKKSGPPPRYKIEFGCYQHTFLTPEQWEQRTGEKWADNAPVFYQHDGMTAWGTMAYFHVKAWAEQEPYRILVCNGPEVPGDD